MDKYLAELIGIILGDGNLSNPKNHYRIGFTGDPIRDREYFDYIKELIRIVWNKDARIFRDGRAIRIVINSKQVFLNLTQKHKLPVGDGKSYKVIIPEGIVNQWGLAKHTIRGFVDTDGSIFTANKRGSPNYPSIELNTCSFGLALQLRDVLTAHGFRVNKIREDLHKKNLKGPCYKVVLNGYENVAKWLFHIGFSNPVKKRKAQDIMLYFDNKVKSVQSASGLYKGHRLSA